MKISGQIPLAKSLGFTSFSPFQERFETVSHFNTHCRERIFNRRRNFAILNAFDQIRVLIA